MANDFLYSISEKLIKIIIEMIFNHEKQLDSGDIASILAKVFQGQVSYYYKANNTIDSIKINTRDMFASIIDNSLLNEDSRNAVLAAINDSISKSFISAEDVVKAHNKPSWIYDQLISNCADIKHMTQAEEDVVKKCFRFSAQTILSSIAHVSVDYTMLSFSEVYNQIEELKDSMSKEAKLIVQSLSSSIESQQNFEEQYFQIVTRNHRDVELFTSRIGMSFTKNYRLDIAYIELELQSQVNSSPQHLKLEQLFSHGNKWIITGEAGCGKTTLLQWLLLSCAQKTTQQDFDSPIYGYFPVYIPLRKIVDWNRLSLRKVIDDELYSDGITISSQFLRSLKNTGKKLLLLVDGLDEIETDKRQIVLNWIDRLNKERNEWVISKNLDKQRRLSEKKESLTRLKNSKTPELSVQEGVLKSQINNIQNEKYENNLIVVLTSRPIIDNNFANGLDALRIKKASVLPMTHKDVCRFIDYWHSAISYGRVFNQDDLIEKANQLKIKISQYEAVSKLAQNPLLCAMICALHYSRNGVLPSNRLELYDECCQMLLNERDQLRTIISSKFQKVSEVEYEDKRRILGDLALWMLECDGALQIDYNDAKNHLKYKLENMKFAEQWVGNQLESYAALFLDYFIERGGILRWVEENKIGFIHKTFQEYFSAYQIYLENSWPLIKTESRALNSNWRETILLSIAFSNKDCADNIIKYYLAKSSDITLNTQASQKNAFTYDRKIIYRILAINGASLARELTTDTKDLVQKETRNIIPPTTDSLCESLSLCGNLVVPLLNYKCEYTNDQQKKCAKVLVKIQTSQSIAQLSDYLYHNSSVAFYTLASHWAYLSNETINNSNIVPYYIRSIVYNTVSVHKQEASINKRDLELFEETSEYCTLDQNDRSKYYLSATLSMLLSRKLSAIKILRINNYAYAYPLKDQCIAKILDLFSIGKNIIEIHVSYDGSDTEVEIESFCEQFDKYKNLETVHIYGLTDYTSNTFQSVLSTKHYSYKLSIQHDKNKEAHRQMDSIRQSDPIIEKLAEIIDCSTD